MSGREKNSRDRLQKLLIKKRENLLKHSFGDLIPESIIDKCTQFVINPEDRYMLLISYIVEFTNWEQIANENQLVEIFNYYANILVVDKQSKVKCITISSDMISTIQHTWNCRNTKKLSSVKYLEQLQTMKVFIKRLASKNILDVPDLFKSFDYLDSRFNDYVLECSNGEEICDDGEDETPNFTPPPKSLIKISEEDKKQVESQFEDFQWKTYLFASFIYIIH